MTENQIRHTVAFSLKHELDSPETKKFLYDAQKILTSIPTVQKFEILRQISHKNHFSFGFSMEFDNEDAFNEYTNHPTHVNFVLERWDIEVASFQETDYRVL